MMHLFIFFNVAQLDVVQIVFKKIKEKFCSLKIFHYLCNRKGLVIPC